MGKLTDLFNSSTSSSEYFQKYIEYLHSILKTLDLEEMEKFIIELERVKKDSKKVIFLGNGGSAATCSHFVNDLSFGIGKKGIKAISLADNTAVLTAISNDYGYDQVFSKQLELLLGDGDLVVMISASGNSQNLISSIEYCQSKNVSIVGITGFDGGQLKEKANISIHFESASKDYGPVEDAHLVIDHMIASYFYNKSL